MDVAGLVVAIAAFAYDICDKCQNGRANFRKLERDLQSLQGLLCLADERLPHDREFQIIRNGCEEVRKDLEKVISKYAILNQPRSAKRLYLQATWSKKNVDDLRSQLSVHVNMLNTCATLARTQHFEDTPMKATGVELPTTAVTSQRLPEEILDNVSEIFERPVKDSISVLNALLAERSATYTPGSGHSLQIMTSSTFTTTTDISSTNSSNITPETASFVHRRSIATSMSSLSTSSISSKTKNSLFSGKMQSAFTSTRRKFIAAAKVADLTKLSDLEDEVDIMTMVEALLAVVQASESDTEHACVITQLVRLAGPHYKDSLLECRDAQYKRTPLIWAIISKHQDLFQVLLDSEASTEASDSKWDWTPLKWTIWMHHQALVHQQPLEIPELFLSRLIEENADLAATDRKMQQTPLHFAAQLGDSHAVEILIKADGQLLKQYDKNNMTPLGLAIIGDHVDLARFMIAHGADIQCGSRDLPALTVAIIYERLEIVKLLLHENAELEAVDNHQCTALLWAIWKKNERLVTLLLDCGANAYIADNEGKTAEFWANWTKNKMIISSVARYLGDSMHSNNGDENLYE